MAKNNTEVIPSKDASRFDLSLLTTPLTLSENDDDVIDEIVALDKNLDDKAMVTYWDIGRRYVALTERGSKYGKNLAEVCAARMNKSPRLVTDAARYYRLLVEPEELQKVVTSYPNLSWTHHRSLLSLEDPKQRKKCMVAADKKKLSTRELDVEIQGIRKGPTGKAKDAQKVIKKKNNPMSFLQDAVNRVEKLSLESFSHDVTGLEGCLSNLTMITPRLNLEGTTDKEIETVVYKLEELKDLLEARQQQCVLAAQEEIARIKSLTKSVTIVYDRHTED